MERKKSQIDILFQNKKKYVLLIVIFAIITFSLFITSLFVGQYKISFFETIKSIIGITNNAEANQIKNIIVNIRLPRSISAFLIGGVLSIAGLTYQCVFRNNLVSQDILGVSTSSCVGAAIGIVLGLGFIYIQTLAFAFGIINLVLIFLLSSRIKLDKTLSLILSGILIGGAMSSVLAFIKYMANPETQLQAIVFWTMGDISSIDYKQLGSVVIPMVLSSAVIFIRSWNLNYFSLSDNEAKSLGVNINLNRIIFLICATVLVACSVSISGSIGWVGLVIPQIVRLFVGNNNKYTVPLSFFMGSSFLLIVDILNTIITTAELPMSIISGLLGLPIFIICWFISNKRKEKII